MQRRGRVRGVGRRTAAPSLLLVFVLVLVGILTVPSVSGCGRMEFSEADSSVVLTIGYPIPRTATNETEGVRAIVSYLTEEGLLNTRLDGHSAYQLAEVYVVKPIRTTAAASQERLPAVVPRGAASSDSLSVVLVTFAA